CTTFDVNSVPARFRSSFAFLLRRPRGYHRPAFFLFVLRPPTSTLFPYTTLFRSPEQDPRAERLRHQLLARARGGPEPLQIHGLLGELRLAGLRQRNAAFGEVDRVILPGGDRGGERQRPLAALLLPGPLPRCGGDRGRAP